MGVDPARFADAIAYHDRHVMTTSYGGALVVVYNGRIIGESYTTGTEGGPQPWNARTCNDMKSSTKSAFGTAAGVFLDEYRDRVNLDSYLVGSSREESLIPQIWEQPLTDERKTRIKVKHVLSMTSGHETREPWLAPTTRRSYPGYSGPLTPEWGTMLGSERNQVFSAPHLVFFPGFAIMITVLGFNLLGDGMRDALDPRLND